MIRTFKRYRIIREAPGDRLDGSDFSDRLNAALRELDDKNPRVTFEGMIARIEYEEREELPSIDTGKKSLRLTCQDCPLFEPLRRQDGQEDRRAKSGRCPLSKFMGMTGKTSPVCEAFIDMMENGSFMIVKAKNDD